MKTILVICTLAPMMAIAATSWDGTWRTKLDTFQISGKPESFDLREGEFRCASCVPAVSIPADGKDHTVTGHSYYDTVAVRVVDDSSIQWRTKKQGKLVYENTLSVSDDHNSLTTTTADHTGAQIATFKGVEKRVGSLATGAHAISGEWQAASTTSASDSGTTVKIETTANGFKTNYNGWITDAKFDGKPVPVVGDPGHTMAAFKQLGPTTLEETDTRDGKVTDITNWKLAADGQSIQIVDQDQLHGTTTRFTMRRVP